MYSNYLCHYGTKRHSGRYPWGSGDRPYQGDVTARSNSPKDLADQIFERATKKEPAITKNLKYAARISNAKMYGLEHRLKTKESIERKIKTDSIEKKKTPKEAADDIKDAVRYTFISSNSRYVPAYKVIKGYLEELGYTEVRCKNYFDLYRKGQVKHKSVQSVFRDKDGYLFEIQFQTPDSQRAKDLKVPIYEERRQPGLSDERKAYLENRMVQLAEQVPYPKDIDKIKSH